MTFLDPSLIARMQRLRLAPRYARGTVSFGRRLAPRLQGTSSEFVDFKNYTPGDDIRRIDWKVFGRTDRYYLRSHEGETNCILWLVLDASRSMNFKSSSSAETSPEVSALPTPPRSAGTPAWPLPTKWEAACRAAMGLAFAAFNNNDACGWALFAGDLISVTAARAGWNAFYEMTEALDQFNGFGERTNYSAAFPALIERIPRRSLVIVISDFLGDSPEAISTSLEALTATRHELVALRILDPMEISLSGLHGAAPSLRLSAVEAEPIREVEIERSELETLYRQRFEEEEKRLETLLALKRIQTLSLSTEGDFNASLIRTLTGRQILTSR